MANAAAAKNSKVYIHEFIDIIGHNRAAYMHHMAANWSPEAQEQRQQLCYGIWAVLGSTGRWPQVVHFQRSALPIIQTKRLQEYSGGGG